MSTPFDDALKQRELHEAANAYASRYGKPGSAAYREAWLRFRQQIRTVEDLQQLRAQVARRRAQSHPDATDDQAADDR